MKILLFIISLFIAINSFAQIPIWIQKKRNPKVRIEMGKPYSRELIHKKFGIPAETSSFYDDEIHNATIRHYNYDSLIIETADGAMIDFWFNSRELELWIGYWNQMIRIGDDLQLYLKLPKDKAWGIDRNPGHLRIGLCHITCYPLIFFDENKKVSGLGWFEPV